MKKYICFGGEIQSKSDGDTHYVNAQKVAELYGVNPEECIFVEKNERSFIAARLAGRNNLKVLEPRYDGNYSLINSI